MAIELPRRFTQAWIERTLPGLSATDTEFVLAAMRAKGWTERELEERVYPHVRAGGQDANRRRRRRRPTLSEISAIAGIVGALGTVIALFGPFGRDGDPRVRTSSTAGRAPAADTKKAQAELLQLVPPAVRRTCAPSDELRERLRATAGVSCSLPGASRVAYYRFADAEALNAAYGTSARDLPFGPCGKKWNVESGYHTPKTETDVGLLSCYTVDGTAWIKWTRDDLLLYAYASRADGDRKKLFQDWNAAGPNH